MLAEEFGYQVSPRPAVEMTPAVQDMVDKRVAALGDGPDKVKDSADIGCFVLVLVPAVAIALSTHEFTVLVPAVPLALLVATLFGKSVAKTKKAGIEAAIRTMEPIRRGPWQAWPGRLEEIPGQPQRKLLLLGPDGSVAREFHCLVPDAGWTGLTDGRGLIWFVGDLRFGGIAGLPGGKPMWWTGRPVADPKPKPPAQSGVGKVVEEELAREAVKYVFDKWLS
ncbi:hypothetical protein FNH05_03880 [Amycolatopsis rhizosphaerae]|uniref:Uncharacterized protein n=1 Tax=Amycolatopsis rhizosphaerae TaxID=2053003 RepID=A0A558DIP1_9PSEU|nr:hypothetical protein [Amycolatopsis rhizosphaerae]TVT60865.1 hypothetical protein FNH05_03880 [Amycolatopsis rhizosphaerae]